MEMGLSSRGLGLRLATLLAMGGTMLLLAACSGEARRPLSAAPPPPASSGTAATPAAPAPAPLQPVLVAPSAPQSPPAVARATVPGSSRPLLVIQFDGPNVDYGPALYNAMTQALNRTSNPRFELVETYPERSGSQRPYGRRVADTIIDMGLPADRLTLSPAQVAQVKSPEVRLFVR